MAIAKYYIKRYGMIALIMNILTLLFLFIFQNFSAVYMLAALWVGFNAVVTSLFMQNDLHARDRLTLLSSLPVSRVSYFLQTYLVGLLFALLPPVICILGHLSPHLLLTALECYVLATLATCDLYLRSFKSPFTADSFRMLRVSDVSRGDYR